MSPHLLILEEKKACTENKKQSGNKESKTKVPSL